MPAVEIGPHSAVLRGEVNPNGSKTTCYFEYGTTKAYGMVTPVQHVPALRFHRNTTVQLRARITGLMEGTEYHYQLVCLSNGNTTLGGDMVFHTTRHAPVPTPPSQPGVKPTAVTKSAGTTTTSTKTAAKKTAAKKSAKKKAAVKKKSAKKKTAAKKR